MAIKGAAKLTRMLLIAVRLVSAQSSPCDPHLPQPAQNPYGYRLRGDRCEGIYVQEVGGSPLLIASWTESFPDYDLTSRQPVAMEWDTAGNAADVRLRAQALRRRLYYRMDAVRPGGVRSFTWPSDLLAALSISKPDIGIAAVTRGVVAGGERDIYLPLRISQGARPARAGSYRLVLVPGVEIKELFLTLTVMTGSKATLLKDGESVGYGYYPAEQPIEIPVSGLRVRGFYHLEIGATLKNGGVSATDLWFYHPGS